MKKQEQRHLWVTEFFTIILFLCLQCTVQAQSFTFNYTGSVQTYTVPPGVTSLHVVALGAAATFNYSSASLGGKVEADLAVTAGQVLNIYVGGTSGWNGGVVQSVGYGISSGDATDIRIGGTALANRVLVAGGAGARGGSTPTLSSTPLAFLEFNIQGSAGGGLTADNGADNTVAAVVQGNPPVLLASGGKGGTSTAGGVGGSPNGVAGQLGKGGSLLPLNMTCGSGGGGYYGGGSGGWNGSTTAPNGGGGGGGSSYTSSACTNVIHTKGVANGFFSSGLVTITPSCPTGSQPDIALTGNNIDILNNDITPSTNDNTDLGSAVQTTGSITKNFVIKNTGSAALSVSSISFSGTNAALFSLVSPPTYPFTIAAGGSQTIAVKFTPTALGTKSASMVIINSDCDESIYKVSLQGTGICATDIQVMGNTDFGDVTINTPITKTFVIQNLGTGAALTISSIWLSNETGGNTEYFSLISAPTFPLAIPVGGSQTITVQCLTSTLGAKRAHIGIISNDCTASNFYFTLSANGVCPTSTPEINIQGNGITILDGDSSPSTTDNTDFGDVNLNYPLDKTFVIQNSGNANLSISGISTSQIYYSTEFTLVNPPTFPLSIAAGGSQTITVRFLQTRQEMASSKLIIYSNDCDESEYDIALQGNGIVTPASGLNFDGDGDYVLIQDGSLPYAIANSDGITIEYWFKGSNAQSAVRIQNGSDYIVMGWNNDKHIISTSGGTDGGVSMGAAATDGNWHHIAMTWQKATQFNPFGTLSSYLDGSLVDEKYGQDFSLPNPGNMYLGGLAGSESMNGTLDKLRIWSVARTQSEIQANMSCDLPPQSGLLASYNFDQGNLGQDNIYDQTLYDYSNNNYNGYLQNFALTGSVSNWVVGHTGTPSVSIAITAGSQNITQGTSVTFKATPVNGGATPTYQWKKNGSNVGANSGTYTNNTLANNDVITCDMTSTGGCIPSATTTSNSITMSVCVTITPSVSIAANPNTLTVGASVTFTATPTNGGATPSYQWKNNGTNVGTNSSTYTKILATGDGITCVLTSSDACASPSTATSNTICVALITPSVTITSSDADNSITAGTSVTFTATPINGGTTPSYQWKNGSTNVGSNSATYTTSTLANNDVITCVMTSSATCASPTTATSTGITTTVIYLPGAALHFDGTNDYISNTSVFTSAPTAFTVEFWINPGARGNYFPRLGATNEWGAFLLHAETNGGLYVGTDVTNRMTPTQIPAGTVLLNTWQHFAFTYANGTGKFYKNGTLIATKSGMSAPTAWGGWKTAQTDGAINGSMDELRIWSVERTQAQIQANKDCELSSCQTGLVAYYKFNQGIAGSDNTAITTATDASGNGNTGTLTGFARTGITSNFIASSGVTTGTTCTNTITWTGTTSTNWATATNWSPNCVPSSIDNVIIPTTANKPMLPANQTIANMSLTGTNKVMLGNSTLCVNAITGGSASSYIVTDGTGGLIIKALPTNAATTFPIGSSETSYDPLSIRPTNSVDFTAKVKATTIAGDFSGSIANFAKTTKRQWDITPSATAGSTVLTLTNGGTAYTVVGTPKVGHYNGTAWSELEATHDNGTWTATTTSFSPFGVGEAGGFVGAVLPVELLTFTGYNKSAVNVLNWTTAHEVNNKGFQVERLNIQTQTWDNLGFIAANNKAGTYQFTDNTPLSTSYYRLRQIDNDGKEMYSKVISVSLKGSDKLKVYPNPVSDLLIVETELTSDFQILNLLGQQVMNGKAAQRIDVSALPQGAYFLKMGVAQVKFVKQ